MLKERNQLQLAGSFAGGRLKKFHLRQRLEQYNSANLDHEQILTLNKFVTGKSDSELSDAADTFSCF